MLRDSKANSFAGAAAADAFLILAGEAEAGRETVAKEIAEAWETCEATGDTTGFRYERSVMSLFIDSEEVGAGCVLVPAGLLEDGTYYWP